MRMRFGCRARPLNALALLASGWAVLAMGSAAGPEAARAAEPGAARSLASDETWRELEPGLELGIFTAPVPAETGDSRITVLRIDGALFEFRLMNASAPGEGEALSAREWCRRKGLAAAVNASMYREDLRTSISLMRTRTHVNNPRITRDKAVLAFDRRDESVPAVQIIDRECQDLEDLAGHYGTLVQSIRMISCREKNVWSEQPRKASTAAIGMDREGRILFIHCRSPYATHDLIDNLRELPLGLTRAMYAEGGSEAQLYVRGSEVEIEVVGSYEVGLGLDPPEAHALPVPNVVGIARRAARP